VIARASALYHLHPAKLRGDALLPMSMLERSWPDLYASALVKYRGRIEALRRPLPELDCNWVDCVQFSTVHREDLRDAMVAAGLGWPQRGRRFLVCDGAGLKELATCIWLYRDARPAGDLAAAKTDVIPFSLDRLPALRAVTDGTRAYLTEMARLNRKPLLAVGVPHILHRGPVPLRGSAVLNV